MIIGSNRKLSNTSSFTVHVNGNTTENVEHFSYLGVTLSTTMTWNEHVTILCTKVNKRLGLLRRIRYYCRTVQGFCSTIALYYHCLATATLFGEIRTTFCLMESLQILQNKAAKIILNRSPLSSATDALNTLGWRKLAVRRYYHRCKWTFTSSLNWKSFQERITTTPEIKTIYVSLKRNATGESRG